MTLQGKTAIVTGGSGGIGSATARLLAAKGAKVFVADIQDDAGTSLAAEIGGVFVRHDVADEENWARLVERALSVSTAIDILVNCAGIEGDFLNSGLAMTLAEWRRVLSVNLDGTFLGCRAVMPHMLEAGQGSIVNLSSVTSAMATATALAYGASKAAVEQLSRSMAIIGARDGKQVRCNSVHPGMIATRMSDDIISRLAAKTGRTPNEVEAERTSNIPLGRRGSSDEIAVMITYLASDEARYVTGTAMYVDGGLTLKTLG